jgi:acetate kinase
MSAATASILTLNGGSSSIRFAVFAAGREPQLRLTGAVDRIGLSSTTLRAHAPGATPLPPRRVAAGDHRTAGEVLLRWLEAQPVFASIAAVGHRVVQGGPRAAPERVTPRLLRDLRRLAPFDPEHLPRELGLIEAVARRHPRLPQIACFDTAFHRGMPRVARLLPLPRRLAAQGVERYGYHGLSFTFLMEELRRLDPAAASGRVILAHLGNGASLAAVHRGRSRDTSMGFTPAAGLVMGTRTGDLDPGLGYYLARTERLTAAGFQRMVSHDSGLLGVSGTSSDVRELLAREGTDSRAADALALFCYQAKKWIGAYAAALGGIDTLIFAGGIGEHAPAIRARICAGLDFLGVALHRKRNARSAALISKDSGRVAVRVIPTDEERMIARAVCRKIGSGPAGSRNRSGNRLRAYTP